MAHLGLGNSLLGPQGTFPAFPTGKLPFLTPFMGYPSAGGLEQLALLQQQRRQVHKTLADDSYPGFPGAGVLRATTSPAEGTRPESAGVLPATGPGSGEGRPAPAQPQPRGLQGSAAFSVTAILSPGFGQKAVATARRRPSSSSVSEGSTEDPCSPPPGRLSPASPWSPYKSLKPRTSKVKTVNGHRDNNTTHLYKSSPTPKIHHEVPQSPPKNKSSEARGKQEEGEGTQPPTSPRTQGSPAGDSLESKLPAWVYCTRYSDRPSAGPRSRKKSVKKTKEAEQKRPRTAFNREQLEILRQEFEDNKYLSEERRKRLANELELNESQIKIWFQNRRAKVKKCCPNSSQTLALELMAQGLYNHSTVNTTSGGEDDQLSSRDQDSS